MANFSNVILISDDETIEESMSLNLIPLREMDSFSTFTYEQGFGNIGQPDVILIYCNEDPTKQEECIKLIRHLKNNKRLFYPSLVLILDEFDKKFLLSAYSEDITDFILKDSEKGSTLVKIMWALKQHDIVKSMNKTKDLLKDFRIIDEETGFYLSEHREKIFNHELNYIDLQNQESSIMIIGSSDEGRGNYNYKEVSEVIKGFLRNSDIIIQGPGEKIYILMPNTPADTAPKVFEKISTNLKNPKSIIGAITNIFGKSFSFIETSLLSNLQKAENTGTGYIVVNDTSLDEDDELEDKSWQDWMKSSLGTPKNYKIFKNAYNKKLNNIIIPTFFQLQKAYENKLFETEVNQIAGESSAKFILKKGSNQGELQINYNGFAKININIIYNGFDSPENQNYDIELPQITEDFITKLVKDFINSFTNYYKE